MVLIGLPDDTGVALNSGRVGAAGGPNAVREALATYGVASPADVVWPRVFDAGDVVPAAGTGEEAMRATHDRVSDAAQWLVLRGLFPIAIGGGHDLTYAFVRGVLRGLRQLKGDAHLTLDGVYLDAHLDVRDTPGSGMPFRRLIQEGFARRLCAAGINPFVNDRDHTGWLMAQSGSVVCGVEGMAKAVARFCENPGGAAGPMFFSLDMDVFDSAYAPGVSAINPSGASPREIEPLITLAGQNTRTVCFDIMELCPAHDVQGRAARLAAHMLLAFLAGYSRRSLGD